MVKSVSKRLGNLDLTSCCLARLCPINAKASYRDSLQEIVVASVELSFTYSSAMSALTKFFVNKVATAGKFDLYPLVGEKTITANNAPPIGRLAQTTQQISRDAQGSYLVIDITNLVKQWLGDGTGHALPNYGFALLPHPVDADTPQVADINLDSEENSQTSHDGLLSVQLS